MSSSKFAHITERRPGSAHALALLGAYLEEAAASNRLGKLRLDPKRIQQIGEIPSSAELAALISILLAEHVLRRIVVVQSPLGAPVAEFGSVDEVPEYIHDHLSDTQLRVTPDNLRMVYVAEV